VWPGTLLQILSCLPREATTVRYGFGPRSITRLSPLRTRNSLSSLKEGVVTAHCHSRFSVPKTSSTGHGNFSDAIKSAAEGGLFGVTIHDIYKIHPKCYGSSPEYPSSRFRVLHPNHPTYEFCLGILRSSFPPLDVVCRDRDGSSSTKGCSSLRD
jgi:hypothetical protein